MVLCLLYRVFSELKYLENNVDYIEERGKLEFLEKDPLEQGQEPVKACFCESYKLMSYGSNYESG